MSRIGNNPISIPEGVSVNVNNNVITVNGKNGECLKFLMELVLIYQITQF